jgi:hypothetical protein
MVVLGGVTVCLKHGVLLNQKFDETSCWEEFNLIREYQPGYFKLQFNPVKTLHLKPKLKVKLTGYIICNSDWLGKI